MTATEDGEMLGFVLSRYCMAECGHCGSSAGPDRTARMARPTLRRAIRSAAAAGVRRVAFTGGEPLAHQRLVLEALQVAHENGLHTTLCTNAFWATDDERASSTVDALVAAGLDRIQLSTDRWHLDYIAADVVVRAAEHAAHRVPEVQVAIPAGRSDWVALELVARFGHIPGIEVFTHPAHAVGRGEHLPSGVLQPARPRIQGCHLAGHHEIDVDGRVSICPTSADFGPASVLRAGDAGIDDLGELLRASASRPLPHVIATWGPMGVARLAGWPDDRAGAFAHDCQLCRAVHSDDAAVQAIRDRHGLELDKPVPDPDLRQVLQRVAALLEESPVAIRC